MSAGDAMRARTGLGEPAFCQHVDVVINVAQKRQTREQILKKTKTFYEWLQASICRRPNTTVHSGVITFRAAVRFRAHSGLKVPQAWKLPGKSCVCTRWKLWKQLFFESTITLVITVLWAPGGGWGGTTITFQQSFDDTRSCMTPVIITFEVTIRYVCI